MSRATALGNRPAGAITDEELLGQVRAGDRSAFRVIMEQNNARLYRLARSLMRDELEAEDVLQEVYLRAFSKLSSFRGESSLATWLARITLNEALGRKRKQRPMLSLEAIQFEEEVGARILSFPTMISDSDPEQSAARREIRKLLEDAIDALPEAFRVVFVMREVEDMSVEETAALLKIRSETVKTRLHRARRLLRASLDDQLSSALKGAFPFAGIRCARIIAGVLQRFGIRE